MARSVSFYVWYHVDGEPERVRARAAVAAMIADLAAATGVRGRLLSRTDDPSTWMEVYENVGDEKGFAAALAAAAADHGVDRLARDRRHIERFVAGDVPGA